MSRFDKVPDLDLGDDHLLYYTHWSPDRTLNPQYEGIPDIPKAGAFIEHKTPQGIDCTGAIWFDVPNIRHVTEHDVWQIEKWEPLTISPSVLCKCGDHGFIKEGRWARA